ncbi:hypothetical protein IP79_11805 [Porphyrobacter sp. AAP60]|nr:hypothetical protein IP79_11805 [Porphyrobacter sp. AAP60]
MNLDRPAQCRALFQGCQNRGRIDVQRRRAGKTDLPCAAGLNPRQDRPLARAQMGFEERRQITGPQTEEPVGLHNRRAFAGQQPEQVVRHRQSVDRRGQHSIEPGGARMDQRGAQAAQGAKVRFGMICEQRQPVT